MAPPVPGKKDPELLKLLAELGAGFTPVLGEGLSLRDAYRSFKKGDKLGMGLGLLGALPLVGMVGKAGKFARGADVVADAVKASKVERELSKTAAMNKLASDILKKGSAPVDEDVARRAVRVGERLRTMEHGPLIVLPREVGRGGGLNEKAPLLSKVFDRFAEVDPEAGAKLQEFIRPSVVQDVVHHGTDAVFEVPNIDAQKAWGLHVGTPGQAAAIKERSSQETWNKLQNAYNAFVLRSGGKTVPTISDWVSESDEAAKILKESPLTVSLPGHNVLQGVARVENPIIMSDLGSWTPGEIVSDMERRGIPQRFGLHPEDDEWLRMADDIRDAGTPGDFWNTLEDLGTGRYSQFDTPHMGDPIDAIQYLNVGEDVSMRARAQGTSGWSWILSKPEQFKSIWGNRTFNPNNPNMFKALAGTAGAGLLAKALMPKEPDAD